MKTYKIVILGPPGSGKGTQAKMIAEKYGIEHISTGDIFRAKRGDGTELGNKIKELIDNGNFVPDDITIKIIEEKLGSIEGGYMLDGFPRTIPQAEALKGFADINMVIYIDVKDEVLVSRLSSRLMCKCGESYNKITKKPKKDNFCDKCNQELYQREDETPEVVQERLKIYKEKTEPLLDFYKDILVRVDGDQPINKVFEDIKKVLS
ncbi:MAG: adenylate kinase [Nanoarchaeota archaeon]|nr:adenylate kinase [Nanoarchaeota archaeon]MCG2717252.1 adenylate kinase [Nanoarchaeota archaeon]